MMMLIQRALVAAIVAAGCLSGQTGALSSAQPGALVNQYCTGCHNAKAKVGGLALDKADFNDVASQAEMWEKVIKKLRTGAMPPLGMPRPDKTRADAFATWLETSIDKAAALKPNPGRPALHRLNRAEYANAIRDLLALEVDSAEFLPADDASFGFDNVASVLGLSPALQERYVSAAAKISRLAVGDPATAPIVDTYRVRSDISQDDHIEGLPLGTRGGVLIHHNFPLDGEYVIKVKMLKSTVDLLFGGNSMDETLEVAINGALVKSIIINPKPKVDPNANVKVAKDGFDPAAATKLSMSQPPDSLETRVFVKAGPQTVTAAFLKKSFGPVEDLLEPLERSTFDPSDPRGLPHVLSVSIGGPFEAKGSGDTPSRRRIFACRPATAAEEMPCARKIISTLAKRAYREPITDTDLETLLGFYQQGRNSGNFESGVEMALRRMLASPQFLFRFERDPANTAPDTNYRISDLDLASRLSFFLWSSIPDDELTALASQGKLRNPPRCWSSRCAACWTIRARKRWSRTSRGSGSICEICARWRRIWKSFRTSTTICGPRSRKRPSRSSAASCTKITMCSICWSMNYTLLNDRLARHYGIPNIDGSQFRRITVTDDARRGLLGQGSILTVTSVATRTSPVQRGKWLLENVLGTPPNPPPAGVPPLKENPPGAGAKEPTVRERMEQHRADPACAGCHKVLDPLGFALDNFDGVGVRGERWVKMVSGLTRAACWLTGRR